MFPLKIPIERIEEYHTHYLGKAENGAQFWGYVTFAYTKTLSEIQEIKADWQDYQSEYALLHIFDEDGKYSYTKHYFAGTTKQTIDTLIYSKLEEMVNELGNIEYQDIEVSLYQTEIDGIIFGLIQNDEYGVIDLQPHSTISFSEPWDGAYCT